MTDRTCRKFLKVTTTTTTPATLGPSPSSASLPSAQSAGWRQESSD